MPGELGDGAVMVAVGVAVGLVVVGIVLLVARRRVARDVKALVSWIVSLGEGQQQQLPGPRVSRGLKPVSDAVEETVRGLRTRLEEVSRERDEALSFLSAADDGVIVTDAEGQVLLVNRAETERLRIPGHRTVGRPFIEVVQDHEVNAVVQLCLRTGSAQRSTVETEPGREFLGVTATPLGGGGGCVVVFHDLTDVRRLERVRRDFVANISHELRTPLASLKLLAETLSSAGAHEPEVLRDYLGRIEVEVDGLAQMVDELGELSSIETGEVVFERGPVRVGKVVFRAVERLEALARRAGLSVEVDVRDDLPEIEGDERRLEQVLVNLLHNAIKFTPPEGLV
ncbi:MAG: PAS domain-containing protein, partial [Chloroflexi bacterium]|nr:PAS domain-containing protein [Chloroflexota bacterium]